MKIAILISALYKYYIIIIIIIIVNKTADSDVIN